MSNESNSVTLKLKMSGHYREFFEQALLEEEGQTKYEVLEEYDEHYNEDGTKASEPYKKGATFLIACPKSANLFFIGGRFQFHRQRAADAQKQKT